MDDHDVHPAVERLIAHHDAAGIVDMLSSLPGADLTSLLLEVMRRRSSALSPTDVLRRYEADRFVRPGTVDAGRLSAVGSTALDVAVAAGFEPVVTSPLAPLGSCSVVAGVSQNRIVSTMRGTEVASDPTNSLALEAAVRRRQACAENARDATTVRLSATDRVVRAQAVEGPRSFAHFSLLGLVSAGRDTGSMHVERDELTAHVVALRSVLFAVGIEHVVVALSDLGGGHEDAVADVAERLADGRTDVRLDDTRQAGTGYYDGPCMKLHAVIDGDEVEVGDGGVVPWTQRLLGNAKERTVISGLGLDRLVLVRP